MKKSTSELTFEYIQEHPYIKNCLKKGLINYSSLSRLIAKELNLEKKTSKEAILIAARRAHEKLKKESINEKKIKSLLKKSEVSIKNKISVLILNKSYDLDYLIEYQKKVKKESGMMNILEGTDNYTVVTQDKYANKLYEKFQDDVIKFHKDLAIIDLKSPEEIEKITGVVSYVTSIFAENGVNILEFLSCWRDTIFVIEKKYVNKVIKFLNF